MATATPSSLARRLAARLAALGRWRWLHHIAGVTLVFFAWWGFNVWGRTHLPTARLTIGNVVYALLFVAWALAYLVHRSRVRRGEDSDQAWHAYTMHVLWAANPLTVINFWLQVPFADAGRRTVSVLVCFALVAAETVVTVRPPSMGKRPLDATLMPLFIPAGLAAFYLTQPGEEIFPVVPLLALVTMLMLALREFIQDAANVAHRKVLQANAERQEALDAKARFLASASHDLDQPLSSARLFFEQLVAASDNAARAKAGRRLERAFDSLQGMTEQVTRHLQLEAGAVTATRESVAISSLLLHVMVLNEDRAAQAGVELRTLPFASHVIGDRLLTERVLNNFVVNALRHAKARRVLLGAKRHNGLMRLYVIDDGVGVPEGERAALFDDFFQGEHHGETRGGFGLGLASARRMANLMQGQAALDPRWRGGSAFFLELAAS
jgi:signal transduction histidine kinase